jgi:hypothetical protein
MLVSTLKFTTVQSRVAEAKSHKRTTRNDTDAQCIDTFCEHSNTVERISRICFL